MRSHPLCRTILLLVALAATLLGCGHKGELYLAEEDPARAERDARGRGEPFPFPPENTQWPPEAHAGDTADGSTPADEP
jgi:predicted small lipoprotein YifL